MVSPKSLTKKNDSPEGRKPRGNFNPNRKNSREVNEPEQKRGWFGRGQAHSEMKSSMLTRKGGGGRRSSDRKCQMYPPSITMLQKRRALAPRQ